MKAKIIGLPDNLIRRSMLPFRLVRQSPYTQVRICWMSKLSA